MPIGSLIGGMISGAGAAGAGNAAFANSARLAQQNRDALSPYTAAGMDSTSMLNALAGLGYLESNGSGGSMATGNNWQKDLTDAQGRALTAVKGGPLYSMLAPAIGESFTASPSYNFRLTQGQNALSNSAAARGMTLSGAQAKGLTDYNQQSASQEYQNWLNNYSGLVNNAVGGYMNSLHSLSGQGASAAAASNSAANAAMIPGIQAQAQGQAAQAASLGNGIGGAINSLGSLATFGLAGGFGSLGGAAGGATQLSDTGSWGSSPPNWVFDQAYRNMTGGPNGWT